MCKNYFKLVVFICLFVSNMLLLNLFPKALKRMIICQDSIVSYTEAKV